MAAVVALPAGASAQVDPNPEFDWGREVRTLAANALLGAASTSVAALFRGEAIVPAFAQGMGGGALIYAGKRLAVAPYPGSGLAARQVASLGGSIIGNGVAGRGALDRVALSVGPLRFYAGPAVEGVRWRLDAATVVAVAVGVAGGASIDMRESLSSGAVVVRDGAHALPGTIFRGAGSDADRDAYVLAHERVHVIQYDQGFLSLGDPLEGWVAQRVPALRGLLGRVELNIETLAVALAYTYYNRHFSAYPRPYHDLPWEREAIYVAGTR